MKVCLVHNEYGIFRGRISKDRSNHDMSLSTIFLNPCLKEGAVSILLHAMKRGFPVIL